MVQEGELPIEILELMQAYDLLKKLSKGVEYIRTSIDLSDDASISQFMQEYASILAYLPKSLSLLHDIQRHSHLLYQQSDELLSTIESVRKQPNALSSEEQRVLIQAASLQEITTSVISHLEHVLVHTRETSHDLLEILAYEGEDFSYINKRYEKLNLSFVAINCFTQADVIGSLITDINEFFALKNHIRGLADE